MAFRRLLALGAAIGLILVMAIPVAANDRNHYDVNVLVTGPSPDADLVNGWGISRLPGSPWWVSDNGTDLSTLYKADGTKQGLRVAIPGGAPTGTVSSTNAADFHGDLFLFSSEAGIISGWRGALGTTAEIGNDDHAGDLHYADVDRERQHEGVHVHSQRRCGRRDGPGGLRSVQHQERRPGGPQLQPHRHQGGGADLERRLRDLERAADTRQQELHV